MKLLHKCLLCIADRLRRFRGVGGGVVARVWSVRVSDSASLDTQGQNKSLVMPAEMVYGGGGGVGWGALFCSQLHLEELKNVCAHTHTHNHSSQL